jgi:hypothetical protein
VEFGRGTACGLWAGRTSHCVEIIGAASCGVLIVAGELFAATWNTQPTSQRAQIYPRTQLTSWLQNATQNGERVLFLTPRRRWSASEDLPLNATRTHPPGVLPPNGAMVYGLNDANGYDSLASAAYRQFLIAGEGADVSPPRNGNMISSTICVLAALNALNVVTS